MIGLMTAPDTAESVATATRWSDLNNLRHVLVLAAWLLALQTFAMASRVTTVESSPAVPDVPSPAA
jgi:hypothetical protein